MEIIQRGLQRDAFHGGPDGVLDFMVGRLQHLPDVLCHRAGASLTGMNPELGDSRLPVPVWHRSGRGGSGAGIGAEFDAAGVLVYRDPPTVFMALRILGITTGLHPVLSTSSVLVTLAPPFASWMKIRQCNATEHFMLICIAGVHSFLRSGFFLV